MQFLLPRLSFVLGGAASGKSALAERLVTGTGLPRSYIATAEIYDTEMAEKAAAHRAQRGTGWTTIEEPRDLPGALTRAKGAVLIDCATLWLTNLMLAEADIDAATEALVTALAAYPDPVVIVSNETGQGIVPENALARRFRNAQGRLNQRLAAEAELVIFVVAGLPMFLKGRDPGIGAG